MYLSRLILNPRSRRVQYEIASPYELHRTLARACASAPDMASRLLFRLDRTPSGEGLTLLVQCGGMPDWSFLEAPDARGYLAATMQPNPWTKEYLPCFSVGQILAFRLRANPTLRRAGERLGILRDEDQRRWLARKGGQGGFRPLRVEARQEGLLRVGTICRQGQAHEVTMHSVRYDGILAVTDPSVLLRTVETGIGSGKGFGFGMLSLASAS